MLVVFYRNICFFRYCPFIPDGKPCFRHQYLRGGVCSVDVMENGRNAGWKRRQGSVPYPIGNILLRGLLASGASWHMACRQEIGSYLSVSHFPLYLTRHFNSLIAREIMGFVSMYGWDSFVFGKWLDRIPILAFDLLTVVCLRHIPWWDLRRDSSCFLSDLSKSIVYNPVALA